MQGPRDRERGVALIAVLWTLALLAVVAGSLSLESRTDARLARNLIENANARCAADAGINRAIFDLLIVRRGSGTATFVPDGRTRVWKFGQATVRITLIDDLTKVNLNLAPVHLLSRLLVSVGVESAKANQLANSISEYRGTAPRQLSQESLYQAAGLGWGPKRMPFEALEEVQQVVGMTPDIYERIAPHITIYSIAGVVLSGSENKGLSSLVEETGSGLESIRNSPQTAFSIRAEARGPNSAVFIREAVVQLIPESPNPVRILSWRQG